jgi:hypothetical protein
VAIARHSGNVNVKVEPTREGYLTAAPMSLS